VSARSWPSWKPGFSAGLRPCSMRNKPPTISKRSADLAGEVGAKATRKLKARRNGTQGVWFGLGMMGLIGWSVTVPTLLGATLGIWLDQHHPGKHAWTLALLMAGLAVGCLNAWHWVAREQQAMRDERADDGA
jgi:ATP synthase protein I